MSVDLGLYIDFDIFFVFYVSEIIGFFLFCVVLWI